VTQTKVAQAVVKSLTKSSCARKKFVIQAKQKQAEEKARKVAETRKRAEEAQKQAEEEARKVAETRKRAAEEEARKRAEEAQKRAEEEARKQAAQRKKRKLSDALDKLRDATPRYNLIKGTHTKNRDGELYVRGFELLISYNDITYNVTNPNNAKASPGEWWRKVSMHLLLKENGDVTKKVLKFINRGQRDLFLTKIQKYRVALATHTAGIAAIETAYKQKVAEIMASKSRRRLVRLSQCNVTEPTARRKHT